VLEQLAGRGGMGEVYRALDRSSGQTVAVKVLRDHQDGQLERFEREACILAGFDHPRVVRYVAHGNLPSGEPYLAMEWLEGEDLATRIAREQLGTPSSLALALYAAEALGALHDRGIIHRDLKPSNIFLVDGRVDGVKLLDFGLARISEATRVTHSGTMLGTIAYMAPEQARGEEEIDGRVDVFSLGSVLFECLTGEPAFAAAHATAILTKLLFEEAPRLGDRLPGIPAELEALVSRMLSKRPEARPQHGRAAAEALRAMLERGLPEVEGAPTMVQRRPVALMDSERRVVAVILVAPPGAGAESAPESDAQLEREAAAHGGMFERLVDGSVAVLLSGSMIATDLAAQVARCALAMSRHAAGRRIALAMGHSETSGRLPVGVAIDRAVRLLADRALPAPDPQRAVVSLDDSAVGLLDARFDVHHDGGTFVLQGERDVSSVRTLLGKPTPCVGRESELRILGQLWEDTVNEGAAQAVLVTAPPGMGKSRLAQELLHRVQQREKPVAVWSARADSLRAGSAFSLLGQALRGVFGIRHGEPLALRQDRLRARVAERVAERDRRRVTEFLGELVGTPFPDQDSVPLRTARQDPQLMNDQMRAAFLDFVAAECVHHPVLILLEDLHWGDRPSVQFLDRALRDLAERSLFVLALARPEVHEVFPRLWAERASHEVRLRELDRNAIARLSRHVLGDQVGPETIARLAQLSEGNAFYLEELIRATAEARGGDLPVTLVAMVQSRLGALDGEARRLLRAASVFGEVFWTGGVTSLLGLPGDGERHTLVRKLIAQLVDQEILVTRTESRFPAEREYAFRHALLREGAYAMITEEDRAPAHRLAGEWLEAHGEQDALMLAEHHEKGGNGERAGRHYLRAAERTSAGGDTIAAITYARRGLACDIPGELRIALLGLMCEIHLFQLDLVARALPYAEEIVDVAPRGSAPWVQGMLILQIGSLQTGKLDDFLKTMHRLVEIEPSPAAAAPLGLAFLTGGFLLDHLAMLREADTVVERLAALARTFEDSMPVQCYWHCSLGLRAGVREDPASGLSHAMTATAIAAAMDHRRYMAGGRVFENMQRWFLGAGAEARHALARVDVPDEELALTSSVRPFVLAWLLAEQGLMDEARTWAARLAASGQARQLPLDAARGHWALAEVLRREGDLETAEAEIQAALAIFRMACPLDVPGALATLAALRLAQGRPGEARTAAEEGMAIYESIGACSFFFRGAFLRLIHAQSLEAAGEHDAARAALARARQCILANAEKIPEASHRQSFLENVPENRETLALARQWLDERSAR
jgi:tetratricopeptide (TPR) repeat protein